MGEPQLNPPRLALPANRRILVAGASIRAAAESVRKAGYVPWGADLFADVDQIACGPTIRIDRYPHDFVQAWLRLPPSPWIYTGGLENHPALLNQLAQACPLLGIDAATVQRLRNPWELNRVLAAAGFPLPEFGLTAPESTSPSNWLWKPLRSAGGLGIRWANNDAPNREGYFQRFVRGEILGATFLGMSHDADLLGVTHQLGGPDWGASAGFVYGGSIGPLTLEPARTRQLESLGRALRENFALVGLFGVDLVDDGQQFWPLEVNPRYTASVEVLEIASGRSLMAEHLRACQLREASSTGNASTSEPPQPNGAPMHGKAIVYARRPRVVTARFYGQLRELHESQPVRLAADLPTPGSTIPQGAPIVTVFATGVDVESIRATLRKRIAECQEF